MANTIYTQLHQNVLLEWTYDDSFLFDNDYYIVTDSVNSTTSFAFKEGTNAIGKQLYSTDTAGSRMNVADPNTVGFIKGELYQNVPVSTFDRVRLYFPIGHVFNDYIGLNFDIIATSYDTQETYKVLSYYFDSTDQDRASELVNTVNPIRVQDRFWGSYIEMYVPSVYVASRDRGSNKPVPGGINYNITGGINSQGLSQVTPVLLSLSIIESKKTTLGKLVYSVLNASSGSVPQSPRYQTVATVVNPASDGDYFEIGGTFNGSAGEFQVFMDALEASGQKSYVIYTVTLYEENVQSDQQDFYVQRDFESRVKYRPIIKTSSTTSSIRVDMKLINAVDGAINTFTAEYGMLANETLKYGKRMMSINVDDVVKPKIWNSKPAQVIAPAVVISAAARRTQNQVRTNTITNTITNTNTVVKTKALPVLMSSANIVSKSIGEGGGEYVGPGLLELVLHPYDNAVKLRIAENKASDGTYTPFSVTGDSVYVLSLGGNGTGSVEIPLMASAPELDITNGVVVFMVKQTDIESVRQKTGTFGTMYVLLRNEQATTVVYTGKFILSDSKEYTDRTKVVQTVPTTNTSSNTKSNIPADNIIVTDTVFSNLGYVDISSDVSPVVDIVPVSISKSGSGGNSQRSKNQEETLQLSPRQHELIN